MARLVGLGLVLAASAATAAAAEPPVASDFALRDPFPAPLADRPVALKLEFPRVDYGEPARPALRQGFLAAVQVAPNALIGIGMSERKPKRSSLAPDLERESRRGGKKLALRFSMRF